MTDVVAGDHRLSAARCWSPDQAEPIAASHGYRGVRVSKFRHVFVQLPRRQQCYENLRISTSAHDAQLIAVNPKFIAVGIEVAGGGAFQVLPLSWTGKVDYHFGRVANGHRAPVTDLKWSPFNDNVLATASDDSTVSSHLLSHIISRSKRGTSATTAFAPSNYRRWSS